MKETLQIHHIAKRLPYGLKVKTIDGIFDVCGWSDEIGILLDTILYGANAIPKYKPILFPLSCLTQEITVNGETFTPIVEILKKASLFDLSNCDFDVYLEDNEIYVNAENKGKLIDSLYYDFNLFHSMDNDLGYNPTNPQSELQDLLLAMHIDLPHENLIEKGLAISVFDLDKNPYE